MSLFFLLDQVALPVYLILGALAAWHLWRVMNARAQMTSTYYELERDLARQRRGGALTWVVAFGLLMVMVLGVQRSVVPFLRTELEQQEIVSIGQVDQDSDFRTATPAPVAGGLNIQPVAPLGEDSVIILLTPTLTPTPVGTIIPNTGPVEGCVDPRATLQVPANGMKVFQPITIIGTAYTDSFSSAKLELISLDPGDSWRVIDERRQEARETMALSQFSPINSDPGTYKLRLVVFNLRQEMVASCMVTIYITEPPVTPTQTPVS